MKLLNYQGNDIYCDLIIPRKIDIQVVKETENMLAYHHTRPYWPVHIVVTPKKHVASLLELVDESPAFVKEFLALVREIAAGVKEKENAARVLTNLGDYQDSKHLHVHIGSGQKL